MLTRKLLLISFVSSTLLLCSCSTLRQFGKRKRPPLPPHRAKEHSGLFPARQNGKYGFIDNTGKMVIAPQFDYAGNFSDGLAKAAVDGKIGFIDKSGRFRVEPQFALSEFNFITLWGLNALGDFHEGLALVKRSNRHGFISETGQMAVEPKFEDARDFSEKLAAVKINSRWGFIDQAGRIVVEPKFEDADSFSEGLAPVKAEGKFGFIDASGKFIIKPTYFYAARFSQGVANVSFAPKGTLFGNLSEPACIDKTGATISEPHTRRCAHFSEGLAIVQDGSKVSVVDETGEIRFVPQLEKSKSYDYEPFSEGLALVKEVNGKSGYIGRDGQVVIPIQFSAAESFAGGLAFVSIDQQSGYIDRTGKFVWINSSETKAQR
jgi:hypothetical protein